MSEETWDKTWHVGEHHVAIVDIDTGEMLDPDALLVERQVPRGREYWWRMMVCDLIGIMDELPGKQIHAISAILDCVEPWTNGINKTVDELAERAGCSAKTMQRAMHVLMDRGLIRRIGNGRYMMDPHFMSQGGGITKLRTLVIMYDTQSGFKSIPGGKKPTAPTRETQSELPPAVEG